MKHERTPASAAERSRIDLDSPAYHATMADFVKVSGRDLLRRTEPYFEWQSERRARGVWPYASMIAEPPGPTTRVRSDQGKGAPHNLNMASQDYLSLSSHPEVVAAARDAISSRGLHSAGSPYLQGNTPLSLQLEEELAETLRMEHVVLFPTGWSAGYGTVMALVRKDDHIVIDRLAHNCLAQGSHGATRNIHRFDHNDVASAVAKLRAIRATDTRNGILLVTEGLFSMDADTPDIRALQEAARAYDATLLVDVAHDFGSMGPGGTGSIGAQRLLGEVDLVMGSFSKTFASNGGFLATRSAAVKQYVKAYGPPHIFSNALSPPQCAAVLAALGVVRSEEGVELRRRVRRVAATLRDRLAEYGIECIGQVSPIVPVPLGSERVARLAAATTFERGLTANLVEYPAVAPGEARFRVQVMAGHSLEQARRAAEIIAESWDAVSRWVEEHAGGFARAVAVG